MSCSRRATGSEWRRALLAIVGGLVLVIAHAPSAWAGCCRLIKVDDETPVVPVRACASGAGDECPSPTFEETLQLGVYHDVCVATPSLIYQEWDPDVSSFSPGVEATCDGGDVEL